jgi:protein involved in polysaccharide export with SLBB domain
VGDDLGVQIAAGLHENDQSTTAVRVQEDGAIILPDIGSVEVAGLEPQAAEAMIQTEAVREDLYRNPTVTVFVKQQKKNRVRVLGAVKSEGTYELSPNSSDVVSAIAAAGGLAINAGQKVEVRRSRGDSDAVRADSATDGRKLGRPHDSGQQFEEHETGVLHHRPCVSSPIGRRTVSG